jgi:hypothetical protein
LQYIRLDHQSLTQRPQWHFGLVENARSGRIWGGIGGYPGNIE